MKTPTTTIYLSIDGDHACALIGENLQEGEAEFDKVNPDDKTLKSAEWHAAMRAKKTLEDRLGLGQCGYYLGEGL